MFWFYVNMQNNISNVGFTSNFVFVSEARLNRLATETRPISINEICDISKVPQIEANGKTQGVIYCIAGVLKNLNEKTDKLFHWFPKEIVKSDLASKSNAQKIVETLNQIPTAHQLKGFYIGGLSKSENSLFENWMSSKMIRLLIQGLRHVKNNDFTAFLFQDAKNVDQEHWPKSAFLYCRNNDTYYVNCKNFKDGSWHDLLDKNAIRSHFDYINISPNDSICINEEQIPSEFFEKKKH